MKLDPEDEARVNRIFQEMAILQEKYGDNFGEIIGERLMGMMGHLFDQMSEEDKEIIFEDLSKDAPQESVNAVKGIIFPFGRPGDPAEIL